jgi:hypothetical protein
MPPKGLARFFYAQPFLDCPHDPNPQILTVWPRHSSPPFMVSRRKLYRTETFGGKAIEEVIFTRTILTIHTFRNNCKVRLDLKFCL